MTLEEYCREKKMGQVLQEWDSSRNQGHSPESLAAFSHKRIWWKCAHGHVWSTSVKERTRRATGCPYCAGKLPVSGISDLKSRYPQLAAEWNSGRNGNMKPEEFTAGSVRKVWWKCKSGHEWQATIENRAMKGNECPYCTGKKAWPGFNDFATEYPDLMKEWHPSLNRELDPTKIRPGAKKRVYWQCSQGHVWDTWLYSRTSKKRPGCPYCAGMGKRNVSTNGVNR